MKNETIDPKVQMTAGDHQPELTAEDVESIAAMMRFIHAKEREMHIHRSTAARRGKGGAK